MTLSKKDILDEGYLIPYMTGDLTADENADIEGLLDTDEEVREEYYHLQKTLELIAFDRSVSPSEVVKRSVMENPSVMGSYSSESPFSQSPGSRFLVAASVIAALLSTFTAVYFWNEWRQSDELLTQLTVRNIELAENYNTVNQQLADIRQDISVLVSPDFRRIILEGTENALSAKAVVYWNPTRSELYLNSANLPALSTDQQYQLWALIDGVPVDAGVFDAAEGSFQVMNDISQADAFAVTVEVTGGARSPTLSTMQVYGPTT